MSTYRDRVGQRVGSIEVLADHKRTKSGRVIWRCINHRDGRELYLPTYKLVKLARDVERTGSSAGGEK